MLLGPSSWAEHKTERTGEREGETEKNLVTAIVPIYTLADLTTLSKKSSSCRSSPKNPPDEEAAAAPRAVERKLLQRHHTCRSVRCRGSSVRCRRRSVRCRRHPRQFVQVDLQALPRLLISAEISRTTLTSPIPNPISEIPYHTPHNKYSILRDRIHFSSFIFACGDRTQCDVS